MRIILILFSFFLFVSCRSKESNNLTNSLDGFPSTNYEIILNNETEYIFNLSSLGFEIQYIPLETNENCYIGEVKSAVITDSRIVVQDRYRESLIIFTINGKFIFRLNPTGKGPKEFLSIGDYSVNIEDNILSILDDKSSKIINYDLLDGKFIETIKIERHWLHIDYFPSSKVLCLNSPRPWYIRRNNLNFGLLSRNAEIETQEIIPSQYSCAEPDEPLLWNSMVPYQDYLSFWESYIIDTIYLINKNLDYIPYVSFDLGSNKIPLEVLKDRAKYNSPMGMEYTQLVQNLLSLDYIFFTILEQRTIKRYVFDKKDRFLYKELGFGSITSKLIKNDIDGGLGFWPIGMTSKNELFQVVNPLELLQGRKNMSYQSESLINIINQISEGSNPIIQIIKN